MLVRQDVMVREQLSRDLALQCNIRLHIHGCTLSASIFLWAAPAPSAASQTACRRIHSNRCLVPFSVLRRVHMRKTVRVTRGIRPLCGPPFHALSKRSKCCDRWFSTRRIFHCAAAKNSMAALRMTPGIRHYGLLKRLAALSAGSCSSRTARTMTQMFIRPMRV